VSYEVDLGITDARSLDNATGVPLAGAAAAAMELTKDTRYKGRVERGGGKVGGRFGEPATEVFKELVHAVSQQTHMSNSLVSSIWKQRLVVTLKRVNIQQQRPQAAR
jgi:hypothetical protein